jgi:hypothetical protein
MKTSERERLRLQRKKRIKLKLQKQTSRLRLTVFRSTKHIYAQIVDDNEGNCLVDYIGKLETVNESYSIICNKLGVDSSLVPFKNVNSDRTKDYQLYYDQSTVANVFRLFQNDLTRFNYKFNIK